MYKHAPAPVQRYGRLVDILTNTTEKSMKNRYAEEKRVILIDIVTNDKRMKSRCSEEEKKSGIHRNSDVLIQQKKKNL